MYGAVEARPRASPDLVTPALVLVLWCCIVSQQMLVKDVVSVTSFGFKDVVLCPYPLFLTGCANGLAACTCLAILLAVFGTSRWSSAAAEGQALSWLQLRMLLLAGLFDGVERGLQNKSFQYLNVATRTMLCSLGIIFTMALARICRLESVDTMRVFALVVLVLGGCLQAVGLDRGTTPITGIVTVFVSLAAGAVRWVMMQLIMQASPSKVQHHDAVTKIKMIAVMKPVDSLFCLTLSWWWESASFTVVTGRLAAILVLIASLIVCIVFCDLAIVSRTSAVALGVVMMLKEIPMVGAGVIIDKEYVTVGQMIGFAVCILGALIYFRTRLMERASAPLKGEVDDP